MNSYKQPNRNYPVLITIELTPEFSVTGFICNSFPKDHELHRQEFPGLYEYNMKLSGADGALRWGQVNTDPEEKKRPGISVFFSPIPLPLFDVTVNHRNFKVHFIISSHAPTQEEMMEFMNFPQIKNAMEKFVYFPYDVTGQRILTAEEWNILPEIERKLRSQTITALVTDKKGKSFSVDYNLQKPLQRILNAGFHTGQSDSGTVSDHPGYRYVADSNTGEYLQGDLIKPGKGSYLTFWKPEAKVSPHNTARQIEQIITQAKASGWRVQEMDIFFEPSIRLCLPMTRDGSTSQELLKEASAIMDVNYPEISFSDDMNKWLDKRSVIMKKVIKAHGGEIEWTDQAVMERWTDLSCRLEKVSKIEKRKDSTEENLLKGGSSGINDNQLIIRVKTPSGVKLKIKNITNQKAQEGQLEL